MSVGNPPGSREEQPAVLGQDFAAILGSITDPFFVLDRDWRFAYINAEAGRVLFEGGEELLGENAWEAFPEGATPRFRRECERAMAEGQSVEFEECLPPHGGRFEVKAYPSELGLSVFLRDAAGRTETLERLRESEGRLRSVLVQYASDIITILEADGTIRYESPAVEEMLGYKPEELLGTNIFDHVHPDDFGEVRTRLRRVLKEPGGRGPVEVRFRRKDGSWCHLEGLGNNLLRDPDVRGIVVNSRDVTERKEAEAALKRNEARFRSLTQNASDIVMVVDAVGAVRYISPAVERVLGFKPEEVVGRDAFEVVHPEDAARIRRSVAGAAGGPASASSMHLRLRHADGTWRHVESTSTNLISDPAVGGVVINTRDVTERRRSEQALRDTENRYRTLVENIPAVTYIQTPDKPSATVYVSPQVKEILGYDPEECTSDPFHWVKHLHPEDRGWVLAKNARTDETGEPFREEYRHITDDGSVVWIRDEAVMVRDEDGNPEYWIGVQIDITQQKLAEEALRGSEAKFRSVVESVGEGLLITDAEDVVLYANPRMTELAGYTEEEFIGRRAYELLLPPERWPEAIEHNRRRARGLAERYETGLRRRNGERFWAQVNATPYRDASGKIVGTLGAIADVTEHKEAERAVVESEQRFRQLFEQSVDALFVHDEGGRFVDCNSRACLLLGYSRGELLSMSVGDISCDVLTPAQRAERERGDGTLWQRAMAGAPGTFAVSHEETNRRKDGTTFPVEVRIGSVDYGGRRMVLASARDITERKEAEEALRGSEERFRTAFENASVGVALVGLDNRYLRVNGAFCKMLGYAEEELCGKSSFGITHPDDVEKSRARSARLLADRAETSGLEKRYLRKDGSVVWALSEVSLVRDAQGSPDYFVAQYQDITDRKRLEEELAYRAFHDSLTGLPNRALMMDRLGQALARKSRAEGEVAILFMDLDDFKVVNDSLGHGAGDRLLVAVAERLRACLRPEDTAARFGGDEFAVLLENVHAPDGAARAAVRIAEELSKEPVALDGHDVFVNQSIGIAVGGLGWKQPEDLLREADAAMYRAKEEGVHYRIFDPDLGTDAMERLTLEGDLRHAMDRREFDVHYQPEVELAGGEVVGFEALLRWDHPERGPVLAEEFIPLAEATGLIVPLGRWVLKEACRQAGSRWRPDGSHPPVSVNISARQLQHPGLVADVREALRAGGLDPAGLYLEITESVVMADAPANAATLRRLKDLGVKLVIDDFGTGYSSLGYLKRLPVDLLKIDRSFVEGLSQQREDREVAAAVIGLAHALGLAVVAEGVETEDQLVRLRDLGCDMAQGNYFAAAFPGDRAFASSASGPRNRA